MSKSTTVITFSNLKPFKGTSAHEWLLFLDDWTQCLNHSEIQTIIMEGKDQGGYKYMGLGQMSTTNSIERIFIEFLNSKLSENEKQYRDFVQPGVRLYYGTLAFHLADEPFTLIKVGQLIPNHPKSVLQAPSEALLLEAQDQFQFPDTWVDQCRQFLVNIQSTATAQQILDAAPVNTLKQGRIIVKLHKIFSNIYFWTSEKLTVETQKIQDRYRITLADPTYVIPFDEVMQNTLTAQNIHTEQFESYKSLRQEKALKTIDRLTPVHSEGMPSCFLLC